jgi:uncharacterized membrane protein
MCAETVLALLRNPDYAIYGFARSATKRSAADAEQKFNELSLEERGKFQAETRSNVGGRTKRASVGSRPGRGQSLDELIVVTILLAAEGPLRLPKVTSRAELQSALSKLGAVRAQDLLAVEVGGGGGMQPAPGCSAGAACTGQLALGAWW